MKKTNKQLLCFMLSTVLSVSGIVYTKEHIQAAENNRMNYTDTLELYQAGDFPTITKVYEPATADSTNIFYAADSTTSAEDVIYQGLLNCQKTINVSSCSPSLDELRNIMQNVINSSPELFYVDVTYSYSMDSTGKITAILPQYTASNAILQQQKNTYNTEMNKILAQVDSSWSNMEKILFIHDYLAQNYEYDTTYSIYDAYNFLTSKKGVCQAYTATFCGLMKSLGMEVSTASSESMGHIWNVVKLNGKWYHIDVTWDDPVKDLFGSAYHNNLLLSDTAIASNRGTSSNYHYDWTCPYICTDTTYDSYFWETSQTPFQYLDGSWYYAYYDNNTASALYSYNFNTGTKTSIYSLDKWMLSGNSYYTSCYSGLDVYNNKLYFNSDDSIFYYDPLTKKVTTLLTPSIAGNIYGLRIDGQKLYYSVAATLNDTAVLYSHTLEAPIETSKPGNSVAPPASTAPENSAAPGISPTPEASPTPNVSLTPAASVTPNVSFSPEPSLMPNVSLPPVTSLAPNASLPPVTSLAPNASSAPGGVITPPDATLGDANGDGSVSLEDARLVLQMALKIIPETNSHLVDVDGNQAVDLNDAKLILSYALKIISHF